VRKKGQKGEEEGGEMRIMSERKRRGCRKMDEEVRKGGRGGGRRGEER